MRHRWYLAVLLCLVLSSCTRIVQIEELRVSTEPEIKSLILTNGKVVQFDENFGWYDAINKIVEGNTTDGKAVSYNQADIRSVELVHAYQVYIAAVSLVIITGFLLVGGYQLLHLLKVV